MSKFFRWFFGLFNKKNPDAVLPNPYPNASRYAICMGLTAVDPKRNHGWDGDCPGADVDRKTMTALCRQEGIIAQTLDNSECTAYGFETMMTRMRNKLIAGDLLVITYSGHGGQVRDLNGDEDDGYDETFCFWDGQYTDDRLREQLSKLPVGVRVLLITDSCHSGTMSRSRNGDAYHKPITLARSGVDSLGVELIHIAGCSEDKYSYGWHDGGKLTKALNKVHRSRTMNCGEWFYAAKKHMPKYQVPEYHEENVSDSFKDAPVFY